MAFHASGGAGANHWPPHLLPAARAALTASRITMPVSGQSGSLTGTRGRASTTCHSSPLRSTPMAVNSLLNRALQ
jgi:hypothetical protein